MFASFQGLQSFAGLWPVINIWLAFGPVKVLLQPETVRYMICCGLRPQLPELFIFEKELLLRAAVKGIYKHNFDIFITYDLMYICYVYI